jgi:hypothetical protein
MENRFQKLSGYSLMIGSFLMIVTMVLHPSGGNFEHLLKIYKVAIIAHSIAIFSIPFVSFGFYGLSVALQTKSKISFSAFAISSFGLIAAMIAAAINGLTLPFYVMQHAQDVEPNLSTVKLILNYGSNLNKSMDYIFIGGSSLSMALWSAIILRNTIFPKWIGYYGLLLVLLAIIGFALNVNFINLIGFRIYIFGMSSWIVLVGYLLAYPKEKI